eukprot:6295301-Prorocentrum_lima.AAC.1
MFLSKLLLLPIFNSTHAHVHQDLCFYSGSTGGCLGHPTVTTTLTRVKLESGFHISADGKDP